MNPDVIEKAARVVGFQPKVRPCDWLDGGGVTAADLQNKTFEPLRWVVPNIIPEGSALLGARPKRGKSYLMLGASLAVASGGGILGAQCEQGDVLGLLLEDNQRRLQDRISQMLGAAPWPKRAKFYTLEDQWPRLDEGGLERIDRWLELVERPRLVVVDVLAKVRPKADKNKTPYENDYDAVKGLTELANRHRVGIVAITHCRKAPSDEDPFDCLSGTTGLTGGTNTTLVIKRGDERADFLYGRGHDLVEFEKAISFDKTRGLWSMLGDANAFRGTETEAKILAVFGGSGCPLSPTEVAKSVEGVKEMTVKKRLQRMLKGGTLRKDERGKYMVA